MAFSKWILGAFLAITFSACQDVVELDVPDGETRLVVDGTVFHGRPLQKVILSTTAPFFGDGETPRVTGATVVIEDNTGSRDTLPEIETGTYQIEKEGELGKSYKLEITLADGKQYGSTYQDLTPIAPIDSIYYQYEEIPLEEDSSFSVGFDFQEPEETVDYYRWSYYINGEYFNEDVTFTDDEFFNGEYVRDVQIVRDFLNRNDAILIEQMSITKEHYEFLTLFGQNLQTSGIFASPPVPVRGNVVNLNDPKDYTLGFFGASDVTTAEISIQ